MFFNGDIHMSTTESSLLCLGVFRSVGTGGKRSFYLYL